MEISCLPLLAPGVKPKASSANAEYRHWKGVGKCPSAGGDQELGRPETESGNELCDPEQSTSPFWCQCPHL